MSEQTLYEILGISKTATSKEIRAAYRRKAQKWHPDRNLNNIRESEEIFKKIRHAYDVLYDSGKRAKYDSDLEASQNQAQTDKYQQAARERDERAARERDERAARERDERAARERDERAAREREERAADASQNQAQANREYATRQAQSAQTVGTNGRTVFIAFIVLVWVVWFLQRDKVPAHTQNPQEQQQEQAHEQQRRYVAQQKLVEQTRQQQQQLLEEQARQRKLAEANQRVSDADTQYKLGRMYYNGDGVQKDEKKAFELWQKAADQRHARAQFYLGLMYEEGWGVQQDDRKAIEWYQKAADQGDAVAKFNLGRMYANSRSAGQNESKLANQQAAQADNPQAVSSKTPNTAIEDMDIREIFEQAGKRAADREINRRVLRVVKLYANSISCGSEINSKNIAALVPYSCEIHDDDNWDDAKYAVFWEGDIGCLNLHSTERTPTYIAIVEMGGNRTFLVNPLQSSPVATWIEQDAELVGNTGDSITLEHSEYDSIDPHCCPTLWVRETYRVDKKGKWRVVNRKIKQKQVDFGDLDFSSPVDLRDVERINLGPPGEDRELTNLKAQDVLDIADASHTLIILGDGGDFVSLKNGPKATDQWVKNGQETVDGQTFDVYTNAYNPTVKILIEQTINRRVKQ